MANQHLVCGVFVSLSISLDRFKATRFIYIHATCLAFECQGSKNGKMVL